MRILVDGRDGTTIELDEVELLQEGDLIVRVNCKMRQGDAEDLEKRIGSKLGRKVVVLDSMFGEVVVIPPENA